MGITYSVLPGCTLSISLVSQRPVTVPLEGLHASLQGTPKFTALSRPLRTSGRTVSHQDDPTAAKETGTQTGSSL